MLIHFIIPTQEFLPSDEKMAEIKKLADVEIHFHTGKLSELELTKADEMILALDPDSCEWDLDAESVVALGDVKAVMISSTSFDWVKPAVLTPAGITITNVPDASSDSVAEYILAMSIELARHLPLVFQNEWKPITTAGQRTLKGKTAGVIGLGNIGTRTAELLQAVGMKVTYWSQNSRDERFEYMELMDLFAQSDLIVPTLAENPETEALFSREAIDTVKPDALWVGIGRVKDLWDGEYLMEKVQAGTLGGYAFEDEKVKLPQEYQGNIWATPPIAWQTQDTLDNYMNIWADNILAFLQGKPEHVVG